MWELWRFDRRSEPMQLRCCVSGASPWCAQLGHKFLVPCSWAEHLGRVPSASPGIIPETLNVSVCCVTEC